MMKDNTKLLPSAWMLAALLVAASLLIGSSIVTAQGSDAIERYADMPQGRTDDGPERPV